MSKYAFVNEGGETISNFPNKPSADELKKHKYVPTIEVGKGAYWKKVEEKK